jgi:hypothetical protein
MRLKFDHPVSCTLLHSVAIQFVFGLPAPRQGCSLIVRARHWRARNPIKIEINPSLGPKEECIMSIFGSIVSAIFGTAKAAAAAVTGSPSTATSAPAAAPAPKPMSRADVEAMIQKLADQSSEKFNWNQSIVDLMKLLKLDSSLKSREQLAKELGYTSALDGSAEMNVWLHKQVMTKLAEGGGIVPASLRAA